MARTFRSVKVNEGRQPNLGTASTGTSFVSIPNYGISIISSAANTYVLDAPIAGAQKYLVSLAVGSSASRVVRLHPQSSLDSIKVGLTATEIAFNSTDTMCVGLLGVNSTQWVIMHATTGATAIGTTGIVFQAS